MATHFTGKVRRLYVTGGRTFVRLDIPAAQQPKESYFELLQTHSNYNALYSLALAAAINRYDLLIRTNGDVSPGEPATVRYMTVTW
jgi:hypothetical protein